MKKLNVKKHYYSSESGSDKLRLNLNKKVTNKTIIEKCKQILLDYGFETIKFYFIIGLPNEEDSDIIAIPNLISDILKTTDLKEKNHKIRVSINYFIPKVMTPFGNFTYYYLEDNQKHLKAKSKMLEDLFKSLPRVELELMNFKDAFVQTILSQIDETFGEFLYQLYLEGGKWNTIPRIAEELGIKINDFLLGINNCFFEKLQNNQMKKIKTIIE